jgi:hypothetical protein
MAGLHDRPFGIVKTWYFDAAIREAEKQICICLVAANGFQECAGTSEVIVGTNRKYGGFLCRQWFASREPLGFSCANFLTGWSHR